MTTLIILGVPEFAAVLVLAIAYTQETLRGGSK